MKLNILKILFQKHLISDLESSKLDESQNSNLSGTFSMTTEPTKPIDSTSRSSITPTKVKTITIEVRKDQNEI